MQPRPSSLRPKPSVTKRFIASVIREDPVAEALLDSPESVLQYWRSVIARQPDHEPDKEALSVILLTTRLRPFAWHRVSVGSINETVARPQEILRPVIIGAAYGFILVHNHPSGEPSPSQADRELTRRVRDASALMQLRFVDHVIATDLSRAIPGYSPCFSFRETGEI